MWHGPRRRVPHYRSSYMTLQQFYGLRSKVRVDFLANEVCSERMRTTFPGRLSTNALFLSVDLNEWGDRGLCVVVRLQFHH